MVSTRIEMSLVSSATAEGLTAAAPAMLTAYADGTDTWTAFIGSPKSMRTLVGSVGSTRVSAGSSTGAVGGSGAWGAVTAQGPFPAALA